MTPLAPTRPVLRWHGGKWRHGHHVVAWLPPHRIYVEPFGGVASVLLQKERSAAEVYNDLDGEVLNLFRVLQDPAHANRLIELLRVTPYARAEFQLSGEPAVDPVERARRIIIRSFMGYGSNAHNARPTGFRSNTRAQVGVSPKGARKHASTGFRNFTGFRSNSNESHQTPAHDWLTYPAALELAIARFRAVVIEDREALKVIAQHDSVDTCFYVDPPYLPETRSRGNPSDLNYRMYRHELGRGGHIRLLAALKRVEGMVVLSGYPSELYEQRLKGWHRIEFDALADGARKRTEVLWINPAAMRRFEETPGPLFDEAAA
jgi:DNA adenine methylase